MYVEGTMKALQFLHIWPRLMQKCSVCHCDTSSKEQKCLLTGATWDKEMVKLEEFLKKLKADVRDEQTYSQEREKLLYADYQTRLELTSVLQMWLSWPQPCRHSIPHILPDRWAFTYGITSKTIHSRVNWMTVDYRKLHILLYYKL